VKPLKGQTRHNPNGTTEQVDGVHPNHEPGMKCWCGPYAAEREDDYGGAVYKIVQHRTVGNA